MDIKRYDYYLPKDLIAQEPARPRDSSRLLVLDRKTGRIEHKRFHDIIDYLKKGDLLVLNNSKVFPARLIGKKIPTGGRMEIFLLNTRKFPKAFGRPRESGNAEWQCLIGGRGAKEGLRLEFEKGLAGKILKNNNDGTWLVGFNKGYRGLMKIADKIGLTPLPPYIKPDCKSQIANYKLSYQTVYADSTKTGSVAAPTAGFHFTKALINRLKRKGVQFEYITLHVGLGTFAPIKTEDARRHKIHAEWVEIRRGALSRIKKAKREGKRIISVGTTSARALESLAGQARSIGSEARNENEYVQGMEGWTEIFIYPGYKFKAVDAMLTNFHLPKTTLLLLVSAFASREKIIRAYQAAIDERYRFYSFGDAMLII